MRLTSNTTILVRYMACGAMFGITLLSGCVSLDPTQDVKQASDLVSERSGAETGWQSPWDVPADDWDGRSPLSADAAVREALQNNRAVRRQVETIIAIRADYVQAHLLPNPVVNVMVGVPIDGMGGDPIVASVVQQLAAVWRRPDTIDAAQRQLQAQILDVSDAALRLVADVRQAHASVVFVERAVELLQENIELLERSSELLRDRLEVGEASRLDLNRVELDRMAEEVRLADRTAAMEQAKRALVVLLGRADASCDWRSDDQPVTLDVGELDEAMIIELAAAQRLDVAAANAVIEASAARVNLEELGRLPDLSASVGYQREFSDREGVFPQVSATVPILDDNRARIARAESEFRQAVIEADRLRQAAISQARTAWIEAQSQRQVVGRYESEIVELARSNHELAEQAFNAGEIDLTVLLEAQRQLNDARIEATDRQLAAAREVIELERAVGGSLRMPAAEATAHARRAGEGDRRSESTEATP